MQGFVFRSTASDVIDYDIPMVGGHYVFDVAKAEVVNKKTKGKEDEKHWRLSYQVTGKLEDGYIDEEQAGRTMGNNFIQFDLDNAYTREFFIAIGVEYKEEGDETIFTFPDTVTSFDDIPEFMLDRQFIAKVSVVPHYNKVPDALMNKISMLEKIPSKVNDLLLML